MSLQKGPSSGKDFDLGVEKERVAYWNEYAEHHLKGRTISDVRYIKDEEFGRVLAITLDDGKIVWPLRDDEGNGPGALQFTAPLGDSGFEGLPATV